MAGLAASRLFGRAISPKPRSDCASSSAPILEWVHGQRRPTGAERMSAWREGAVTLLMAGLLLASPLLTGSALVVFLAGPFIVGRRAPPSARVRRGPSQPGGAGA